MKLFITFIFKLITVFFDSTVFTLPAITFVTLCIVIAFLFFFILLKKLNLNRRVVHFDKEQKETLKELKLIEDQTIQLDLGKYMTLSDLRLKELELIDMAKELEQLRKEVVEVERQFEIVRLQYEAFKLPTEEVIHESGDLQNVVIEDLKRLFLRMNSNDNQWIEKLNILNTSFIDTIMKKGNGAFSVASLKYCICFVIGMKTSEIVNYFNVEQASVHMIRYRLKKKFGLSNDDDLNHFLQAQL